MFKIVITKNLPLYFSGWRGHIDRCEHVDRARDAGPLRAGHGGQPGRHCLARDRYRYVNICIKMYTTHRYSYLLDISTYFPTYTYTFIGSESSPWLASLWLSVSRSVGLSQFSKRPRSFYRSICFLKYVGLLYHCYQQFYQSSSRSEVTNLNIHKPGHLFNWAITVKSIYPRAATRCKLATPEVKEPASI